MNMTLQSSIKDRILAAQKEASDEPAEMQRGMDELIERRSDGALYYLYRIWVSLKGDMRTLIIRDGKNTRNRWGKPKPESVGLGSGTGWRVWIRVQ
ncbi:hypothetical protein Tco_1239140, partial [Tanacetum coccineum]